MYDLAISLGQSTGALSGCNVLTSPTQEMTRMIKEFAKESLGATDRAYIEKGMWCLLDSGGTIPKDLWLEVFKPDSEVRLQLEISDDYLRKDFLKNPGFSDALRIRRVGEMRNEREICRRAYNDSCKIFGRQKRKSRKRMASVLKAWSVK